MTCYIHSLFSYLSVRLYVSIYRTYVILFYISRFSLFVRLKLKYEGSANVSGYAIKIDEGLGLYLELCPSSTSLCFLRYEI